MPGYSLSNINEKKKTRIVISGPPIVAGHFMNTKKIKKSGPRVLSRPNAEIELRTRFGPTCFIIH